MAEQSDGIPNNVAPDPVEIETAARAWGVETDYWDIWGRQHHASTELERAILASLRVDTSSSTALGQAIKQREQRPWLTPLVPAIFLTAGTLPHEIPVAIAAGRRRFAGRAPPATGRWDACPTSRSRSARSRSLKNP